ncbi:MAG: 16S rRNA (cytosine(1402)-N(4))-methyltransferase RsmH [Acidimicrobiales bacterium]
MDRVPFHVPVMADQVVALFAGAPAGVVLDATVGSGGHAEALLSAYDALSVLGIDRDAAALRIAAPRLARFAHRVLLRQGRFMELASILDQVVSAGWPAEPSGDGTLSGALFDLGVSSAQLDSAERGFSYSRTGPLDMRMDQGEPLTAAQLVNEGDREELIAWLRASGEGPSARRIVDAIVRSRPLETTTDLVQVVDSALGGSRPRRGNPAARVFQALRIAVNAEPEELGAGLPAALGRLGHNGRCLVIAYHSGEARLVKEIFSQAVSSGCVCPQGVECGCGRATRFSWVFRGSRGPDEAEKLANPRSTSARLWAVERVDRTEGAS